MEWDNDEYDNSAIAPDESNWWQDILANVTESIGLSGVSDALASTLTGYSQDAPKAPGIMSQMESAGDRVGKAMDKVGGFMERNKEFSKMLFQGVASMVAGDSAERAADKRAQAALDQQNNQANIQRDQNAAFSASVSGLSPAKRGLMQQPLKRVGGANIFTNTGRAV